MDVSEAIYTFYIGGLALDIKPEAIIQLIVILLVGVLAWWSTKDLKRRPEGKKQIVVEYIYTSLMNLVDANMGEKYRDVIPFIGTIAAFILPMNLLGLIGIAQTTKNYSVALTLGLISFFAIQGYAIKKVGLFTQENKKVGKYSLGMRQRLGIAQAIMENNDILILDEITSGLDEDGVAMIYNILNEEKEKGKLIILASHSKEDIQILCDTVFRMDHGKIIATETN